MTETAAHTSRADHMAWCKQRANEILDGGDIGGAWTSMVSDLGKHPETEDHPAIMLGTMQVVSGMLSTVPQMRHFIDGFA